jgi:tetratricopeptide (TPR) repeat protein
MPDEPQLTGAVKVFYSYSHEDEELRDKLEKHLALLRRSGVIQSWHDRSIGAGSEWKGQINEHLDAADIILLLISSSFLASNYCYDKELKRAMERYEAGEARVIPVILRPCDNWINASFGELQALPKGGRAITSWPNIDEAFTDVAEGIRLVAEEIVAKLRAEGARGNGAGGRAAFPLPRNPVSFVARRNGDGRDLVALLCEELTPEKNQVVVLWGAGGVGKTALAGEVARATAGVFGNRVAWVNSLRGGEFNLATLLDEVAMRLDRPLLRKLAPVSKAEQVAALVSAAATLVVLDSFEAVAEVEQARCLEFLAGAVCPALITTRSRVGRDDVYNVPLAGMTLEEARDLLRRLARRTRKPAIFDELDCDDLINKCETNPRIIIWVVSQIDQAKRPQDVLDDLARGEGAAAEHVFTRSFDMPQMGDDGRAALLALSLFTPHASREALAEVASFGHDLRRLGKAVEALSALWLVDTTEANERLLLSGLTREFAKARLSKDARAGEFRRRYVTYFLRYAEAHQQATPEDLDALKPEKENLLGAMDVAFEAQDWQSVVRLSAALVKFFLLCGHWNEGIKSGEQAWRAASELKNEAEVARFKSEVGLIRQRLGKLEEAQRLYEEVLQIARRLDDRLSIAISLYRMGMIAKDRGDLQEARRLCEESLELSTQLNDRFYISQALWGLGNIALLQRNLGEAEELLNKALNIYTDLQDQASTAGVLNQLAQIAKARGQTGEAQRLYANSLQLAERLGHQNVIAVASRNLGLLAEKRGDREEAARLFSRSLSVYEALGSPEARKARGDLARLAGAPV